jgi:hypothetical protein
MGISRGSNFPDLRKSPNFAAARAIRTGKTGPEQPSRFGKGDVDNFGDNVAVGAPASRLPAPLRLYLAHHSAAARHAVGARCSAGGGETPLLLDYHVDGRHDNHGGRAGIVRLKLDVVLYLF